MIFDKLAISFQPSAKRRLRVITVRAAQIFDKIMLSFACLRVMTMLELLRPFVVAFCRMTEYCTTLCGTPFGVQNLKRSNTTS